MTLYIFKVAGSDQYVDGTARQNFCGRSVLLLRQFWSVALALACGLPGSGCSDVPSLQAAAGTSEPKILIADIVKRVKCEIADSFDDKLEDKDFQWLQNWTAKVDLTLQVNDTAGVSPSVSYTKFYKNAFNFAAGSSSLTSTVISAVPQTLTLTAGANYSEQAQRAETLTFTLSLLEVKNWRKNADRYLRHHYGAGVADHFCDPAERELRGNLGLKEWIDSALYPVKISELQAGIHPQNSSPSQPPKTTPPATGTKALNLIPITEAKRRADAAAKNASNAAQDSLQSQSSVASSLAAVGTNMQTNIAPYYAVLTNQLKQILANNLATLTTTLTNVTTDAKNAQDQNITAQGIADEIDAKAAQPHPPPTVPDEGVIAAETAAAQAQKFATDAKAQQKIATNIQTTIGSFTPNPPVDGLLHSVGFIVTYGTNVTPNWSLLLWKGPGLTVPGASLTGVRTNTLSIALGPTSEQARLLLNQTITNTLSHN